MNTIIKSTQLTLILVLIVTSSSQNVMFKQCDSQWGNQRLGYSSDTICSAGCLVTSAAMALASMPLWVNPSTLNTWLKQNGGSVNGDSFVWGSIRPLGLQYGGQDNVIDRIGLHLLANHVVIANVNNGGHYVWVTGVGNGYAIVNDPGFSRTTYSFGQIVRFAWYSKLRTPTPSILNIQTTESQQTEKPIREAHETTEKLISPDPQGQIQSGIHHHQNPENSILKKEE